MRMPEARGAASILYVIAWAVFARMGWEAGGWVWAKLF